MFRSTIARSSLQIIDQNPIGNAPYRHCFQRLETVSVDDRDVGPLKQDSIQMTPLKGSGGVLQSLNQGLADKAGGLAQRRNRNRQS